MPHPRGQDQHHIQYRRPGPRTDRSHGGRAFSQRGGRRRADCAGPGSCAPDPGACTRPAPARLHPDDHPYAGRRAGGQGAGIFPRRALARVHTGRDREDHPRGGRRDRGLCARRAVHVLFRAVLYVLGHWPALGQPRPVRTALPPALYLRQWQKGLSALAQGPVRRTVHPNLDPDGGVIVQNRGPDEAPGVQRDCHPDLRRTAARPARSDPGRERHPAQGLFARRVYRRLSDRQGGRQDVRHQDRCAHA